MYTDDQNKHEKRLTFRNAMIAVAVIIIFSFIVMMYYNMLYIEKKSNIIKSGEVSAKESAERIHNYLTTSIDSLKLAAYSLDGMLLAGRSDEEILDYLVGESTAVRNSVNENMTGLYGYIDGKFMSGTGWVPPAGYEATERPWYTRPMENPGEITLLDPYVDVQSGNTMLAFGKTLCDGYSVLSVDVSLEQIQMLTEEAVQKNDTDIQMILNDQGMVVAHSDINEVSKDYGQKSDTLGSEIYHRLKETKAENFSLDYEGFKYIVYVERMQNGWSCISVMDATDVFDNLRMILVLTILIVVAIILTIGIFTTRSNRYLQMSVRAKAQSDAKSAFLSNISHDIRTPINAMLGMNEMILRETTEQTIRDYAQNIKAASGQLLEYVDGILDFTKMGSGDGVKGPVDYEALFRYRPADPGRQKGQFTAENAHILAVDDNPLNLSVFLNLVKQTQIRTDTAESADEGIELSQKNKYDMIFMDHMMPEKDGIEALREIRGDVSNPNRDTPVICLTANAIAGAREEYLNVGFSDYITKPIDPDELESLMIRFLPENLVEIRQQEKKREELTLFLPEDLKILDHKGIDALAGIKNAGSQEAYVSLLEIFRKDISGKAEVLDRLFREGNLKDYTIRVHSLKSSARIIGATSLGDMAQNLETAGKAGDEAYIRAHHEEFMDAYTGFEKILAGITKDRDEQQDKPIVEADMMERAFVEIRAAADDMDSDRLSVIFGELDAFSIPKESEELYTRLRSASDQFDYEGIIKMLSQEKK